MTPYFLSESGQDRVVASLQEIPDVVSEMFAAYCDADGFTRRISFDPRVNNPSRALPAPYDSTLDDAWFELGNELSTWVRLVLDHRGQQYDGGTSIETLATWLITHIESLAGTPGSEGAPRGIGRAVRQARRAAGMVAHPERNPLSEQAEQLRIEYTRNLELNARGCVAVAKKSGVALLSDLTLRRVRSYADDGLVPVLRIEKQGRVKVRVFRFGDVVDAHMAATAELHADTA